MDLLIIGLGLFLIIYVLLISKAYSTKKKETKDVNIEWYGPDVYLKEKQYPNFFIDDIEEINDRDFYIEEARKRRENAERSNRSNTKSIKNIRDRT